MPSTPDVLEDLVAVAAAVMDTPAVLVDDLSFSNRAAVARIDLGNGETAIAKKPFSRSASANEFEALRVLPADTRPALRGTGGGVLVMEDLGRRPSLADLLLGPARDPAEQALHAWATTLGGGRMPPARAFEVEGALSRRLSPRPRGCVPGQWVLRRPRAGADVCARGGRSRWRSGDVGR